MLVPLIETYEETGHVLRIAEPGAKRSTVAAP
jgi:hypothetical protein